MTLSGGNRLGRGGGAVASWLPAATQSAESYPGSPGVRQIRISPNCSAWSVTAAKSSGRRSCAMRVGCPEPSNGGRPIASPVAKR
jgi:predicted RNA-binding Zn ribbon-like protein